MKRLALFGATGRMGQAVVRTLEGSTAMALSGATASAGSTQLGQPVAAAAAVRYGADPGAALTGASVALDFSRAEAVPANLAACVAAGVPLVIAVTGLDSPAHAAIDAAARQIPVLHAANTSLGVAVMSRLAALAAASLAGFEIEISEAHHRMKRDAPSGTALKLGEAVAAARGRTLGEVAVYARHGTSEPRRPDQVGFSVVRAGDIVGTHTVLYAGADETLEITHRANDRSCFARGALAAANWLAGRPAGLYRMEDVLGF